jgi:hypothetical protein
MGLMLNTHATPLVVGQAVTVHRAQGGHQVGTGFVTSTDVFLAGINVAIVGLQGGEPNSTSHISIHNKPESHRLIKGHVYPQTHHGVLLVKPFQFGD